MNDWVHEEEIEPVEEEPRQPMTLETIGKAGLLWADPALPPEYVVSVTGLSPRELRRLFGAKPSQEKIRAKVSH
ncbi:hypothetical protein P775_11940 [Puniceibacterium antarcticum]|uniref:HTH araC/xylS-type domain-containing protein n=1 Tax=Puniceibacterium antarcticum TaxID=1206336 RepID=A0A2G8REH3_9RHOB|nr:hypothetical protein [Puniceibacterium antarcticum]PIL19967.1 hypothetical protein P775_11940 [Puniceibacterium antarcticum]